MYNIDFSKEKMFKLFNEMIDLIEFKLIFKTKEKEFKLIDLQGANLGDIESDSFDNVSDIINRLDVYIKDYFVNDLCEQLSIYTFKDYIDLINKATSLDINSSEKYSIDTLKMVVYSDDYQPFTDIDDILRFTNFEIRNL